MLRKDVTYSRRYTGIYHISGSCGTPKNDETDTIDKWIKENTLGEVDWELSKKADLLYANGAAYTILSSMEKRNPSWPEHDQHFTYQRILRIRISPPEANLPSSLVEALEQRGLEKEK